MSDGFHTSNTSLQVFVEDVNDHTPKFNIVTADYVMVNSDLETGSMITQVEASDGDVSERNSKISYYLVSGGMDKFMVDQHSGGLVVKHG